MIIHEISLTLYPRIQTDFNGVEVKSIDDIFGINLGEIELFFIGKLEASKDGSIRSHAVEEMLFRFSYVRDHVMNLLIFFIFIGLFNFLYFLEVNSFNLF